MPEYLAPGVYVEEIEIGAKPIEGVSTSTTAFIGAAAAGPILEPTLVTSWSQFEKEFGGIVKSRVVYLGYAVDAFFRNGGKRAYIVRVASASARKSSFTIPNQNAVNTPSIVVEAANVGAQGDSITITTDPTGSISGAVDVFKKEVDVGLNGINGDEVTVSDVTDFRAGDAIRVDDGTSNENGKIKSIIGSVITLEGSLTNTYDTAAAGNTKLRTADISQTDTKIRMTNVSGFYPGSIVHITDGTNEEYGMIKEVEGKMLELESGISNAAGYSLATADPAVSVASMEFDITFKKGSLEESFTNLAMSPLHPRFFKRIIDSELVTVKPTDPPASATGVNLLLPQTLTDQALTGGGDDDLTNPEYDKGFAPLEKVEGISLLAVPGQVTSAMQTRMIDHCEKMRYRFAILDSEPKATPAGSSGSVKTQRSGLGSQKGYAALYYPWYQSKDPVTKELMYLPPSGAVAGIYARSDGERGVHKAPANEKVRGAVGLEYTATKGEQEVLNPLGINVIRNFPGKGNLVWGARTIAGDPLWKYVNVRRLFLYLEESIERATQWVVFEPNNEKLWARVIQTISQFLMTVWKDGALMGTTPEEAFFVKCDRTTMTQNDIDNGKLICVIGVAPVKPAEFVIFRIAQWQGGSAATE